MADQLINYLRAQRKRVGLTQRELASILGYSTHDSVSGHERFCSLPPLIMAFAYAAVFQASVADLFPGLQQSVESAIEKQIAEFEAKLLKQKGRSRGVEAALIDHKLAWLKERRALSA